MKGEFLSSSVKLVNFGMGTNFDFQVKSTIFWLNRGLTVYLYLYEPDFPKSTYKYLCCTKIFRKPGLSPSQQCFVKDFSDMLHH